MQELTEPGYLLLIGFAFFVIATWVIGRFSTSKLRSRIAQDVANRFGSTTSKVSVRLLGNTGAKFSFHQKSDSPLPKVEATILLLDRSNIFHFVYCKIRHRKDQLQIRANLREPASFNLELATRQEQKNLEESLKEGSNKAHELNIEGLAERFFVVVSDLESAKGLFGRTQYRADFEAVAPYLTRLSLSRHEPNLFASVILVPKAMAPTEEFVTSLAKSLQARKRKD